MTTPIPQPPGVPILGNIFDVNPSNTWTSLKTLSEKYGKHSLSQFLVVKHFSIMGILSCLSISCQIIIRSNLRIH